MFVLGIDKWAKLANGNGAAPEDALTAALTRVESGIAKGSHARSRSDEGCVPRGTHPRSDEEIACETERDGLNAGEQFCQTPGRLRILPTAQSIF